MGESREEVDRKWGRLGVAGEFNTWETVDMGTQGSERQIKGGVREGY